MGVVGSLCLLRQRSKDERKHSKQKNAENEVDLRLLTNLRTWMDHFSVRFVHGEDGRTASLYKA